MSRTLVSLSLMAALLAGAALAAPPRVATDIAPVHSLVARVMEGVASPDLIVAPGASPHEYSLRPSEASALQEANVIFWIGPDLTPWLDGAIATLSPDARAIPLLQVEGAVILPIREGALFEAHDHEAKADAHEDHDADASSHQSEHEAHAEGGDHDEHDHGAIDPHVWLSPVNAATWMNTIEKALSASDPENAGAYRANAAAGQAELAALSSEIEALLAPLRDRRYIVFHDAYQYFEHAFDIPASGAISLSNASDPSPARIAGIQARVAEQGVTCVLSEPQFDPGIVATVLDGTSARTGVLDPLGSDLEPGPALYPRMLRNLAETLANCL